MQRIWKDAYRVAGAIQETCSSEMFRRSGRWFPESGCILEHQIFSFGKMIFAQQVQHFVWAGITFSWHAQYLDRWSGQIAKRAGTRPSALHSTFHFWRKSRRIVSILMLSSSKIKEVWQNLFRFWRRQVQKLRKSGRIASFSNLQIDR